MEFKIDTGTDVSVISKTTYKSMNREMSLMPARMWDMSSPFT